MPVGKVGIVSGLAAALLAVALWAWWPRSRDNSGEHYVVLPPAADLALSGATASGRQSSAIPADRGSDLTVDNLSARLRAEPRDPSWADPSTAALKERIGNVPAMANGDLQVRCAATVCEATAWAPQGMNEESRAIYWTMVQGPAVRAALAEEGLSIAAGTFRPNGQFTLYVVPLLKAE